MNTLATLIARYRDLPDAPLKDRIDAAAREVLGTEAAEDPLDAVLRMEAPEPPSDALRRLTAILEVATEAVILGDGVDLDQYASSIRDAFNTQSRDVDERREMWIRHIYPDVVIAESGPGVYYRIPYRVDATAVTFDFTNMERVREVFVPYAAVTAGAPGAQEAVAAQEAVTTEVDAVEVHATEALDAIEATGFNDERREVEITILRPGLSKNNRWYPREAIARDIKVFEGTKMYVDHAVPRPAHGRSVRDWVGTIREAWTDPETGAAKGRVKIVRRDFYDFLKDAYEDIGVSIDALLRGKAGRTATGQPTTVVEGFIEARSVDFVTNPAAGGRVDRVLESAEEVDMDWADVTVDGLRASRPDLIAAVEAQVTDGSVVLSAQEAETLRAQAARVEELERELAVRDSRERVRAFVATEAQDLSDAARELIADRFEGDVVAEDALESLLKPVIEKFRQAIKPEAKPARISNMGEAGAGAAALPVNEQIDALLGIKAQG